MFVFVPVLFESYIENILFILHRESLNIPLPVPWPWIGNFSEMNKINVAKSVSNGMFFVLLPVFFGLSGVSFLWSKPDALKQNAPFVASVFVGVAYMHHAFARADISHLAQAIHPLLIGVFSLPLICKQLYKKTLSFGLLIIVAIMSYFSIFMVSPYYDKLTAPTGSYVKIDIHRDNLWVAKGTANLIETIKTINAQRVLPDEGLLIAPHWPGMYTILRRKSPLWETYFLWKSSEHTQRKQISDLNVNTVNWVILGDVKIDGRDELRFPNTHPLLWEYIVEHFEPVSVEGLPHNYQLLRRTSR